MANKQSVVVVRDKEADAADVGDKEAANAVNAVKDADAAKDANADVGDKEAANAANAVEAG